MESDAASAAASATTTASATGPDDVPLSRAVRATDAEPGQPPPAKKQKKKGKGRREFDFDRYHERHVALRVAYIGAKYHGFASQGSQRLTDPD